MQASMRKNRLLTVAFLSILALPPLVQLGVDLLERRMPGCFELFTRPPTVRNLRAFEDGLEEDSWFANAARPLVQQAQFSLFGDMGRDAVVGRDGWLFYTPGLLYLTEEQNAPVRDCIAAIRDFDRQLAARGIHLIVVPVPGKASVYPDKLTKSGTASTMPSPTRDLIRRLNARGIDTLDLFDVFARGRRNGDAVSQYLAQDTHWSPHGAQLAAEAVASHVLAADLIPAGTDEYDVEPVTVDRMGDIIRMARVPAIERRIQPETVTCLRVTDPRTNEPYRDDSDSPVLILGDSFLRIYESDEPGSAGFIAHLARRLRRPVASLVNDGGASTLVRQTLGRKPQLLEGKKIVIWEFVERDIRFGTDGWQIVSLPPTAPPVRGISASDF